MSKSMFVTTRFIVVLLLVLAAIGGQGYGFYQLVRVVVCAVAAYCAYKTSSIEPKVANRDFWIWSFVVVAILFNPMLPVHLGRSGWILADVATASLFAISLSRLRFPVSEGGRGNE